MKCRASFPTQLRHQVLVLTTEEEWRSIAKREERVLRLADPAKARQEAK
jgi:hypothetical protein